MAQAEGEILLKRETYIDAVIGPQSIHQFNETISRIENDYKKVNSTHFDVINKFDTLNSIKNLNNKISSFFNNPRGL